MPVGRALLVWLLLAVAMIVQGAAREGLLVPAVGPLVAHQISSLTAVAIVVGGSALALGWLGAIGRPDRQLRIGALWLALTVAFEFGFGHYVVGHDWARLLHDYDLTAGRLWWLVLIATALGPWLAGRFVRPEREA